MSIIREGNKTHFNWTSDFSSIEDLLSAKDAALLAPLESFRLEIEVWSDDLLVAILEVFHDFAERNAEWESLHLNSSLSRRFTRPLLFTANALSLFRKFIIVGTPVIRSEEDEDCLFYFPGIALNKRLGVLCCEGEVLDRDFRALSQYLKDPSTTLKKLRLETNYFDEAALCEGLYQNRALEHLDINISACEVEDKSLARVIHALKSHQTLDVLRIDADATVGMLSLEALRELLNSSPPLRQLFIADEGCCCQSVAHLLEGLEVNFKLELLQINMEIDDMPFSTVFAASFKLKSLESVFLNCKTPMLRDVNKLRRMRRLQKPLHLWLDHLQNLSPDDLKDLAKVLYAHSEIMIEISPAEKSLLSQDVNLINDFNCHGRYLLDRPSGMPSSLWPLVFEKANQNVNVVYELLKGVNGNALLGSGNHDGDE
eukprot:scaffold3827_cov179-Cylindrotheca_fusiformis.AAC.13